MKEAVVRSPEDCIGMYTQVEPVGKPGLKIRAILEGARIREEDGELVGILREAPRVLRRRWNRGPAEVKWGDKVIEARWNVVYSGGEDDGNEFTGIAKENNVKPGEDLRAGIAQRFWPLPG